MKKRVLVLCTGNSARSQMAEAIINARRGDGWEAFSAGTRPAGRVHPAALRALAESGIDHHHAAPRHVDAFAGQPFDLVLTVCDDAAEDCPVWPGRAVRRHLAFPDPARATGDDEAVLAFFRQVRDDIERRVLHTLDVFDE